MLPAEILPKIVSEPHESSKLHVTGEAHYVDDRPPQHNELHVGLIYSPHAKAHIKSINFNDAQKVQGVKGIFTASSLYHNSWGSIINEQPFLASQEVNFVGEVVAIVAASSIEVLKKALPLCKVEYEIQKSILNIDDALVNKSFIGEERFIKRGNATLAIKNAPHKLENTIRIEGAEHFYLENQATIAYPEENDCLKIHCSTQHPTEVQHIIAEALNLPYQNVVVIAKRLGGGFGGKETQAAPFALYAALVAHHLRCPARLVLNKDDDMIMTGKRNPYVVNYQVGFDETGAIHGLACTFYGDGGAYADLSPAILERAMAHVDNAYYIPHALIKGRVLRTNFHPHTAFRGFGGPKGVATIEHIIEEMACFLKKDALDIRLKNCYNHEKNTTPYGQKIENNCLPQLFDLLIEKSSYRERRKKLDIWNKDNKNNPRGMSLTAIKFGISFTTRFLNQGHALVHILKDGSVQVATGAVEMGQGVHSRIKTVIAEALGLNTKDIRIMPTATDKSANTSPTAASSGTDLNASAALFAISKIKQRLSALFIKLMTIPEEEWPSNTAALGLTKELELDKCDQVLNFENGQAFFLGQENHAIDYKKLILEAYLSRIPLSAYGFYKVPELNFNKVTGQGRAFLYFTQGVACSEVEIDPINGEVKLLQSDIIMDLGKPINYELDIGQIAGAFIQGVGWITTEALYYKNGYLLSHSPSTYKIPTIHDIPRVFNIDLLKNDNNTINLKGTKASGEPPLMLCFSVWNAIKNALFYIDGKLPNLAIPATKERILRALSPSDFR